MERQAESRNVLEQFCIDFCSIVGQHCKYIIVSGFLVIASGRSRGTQDIDMIIEKLDLSRFILLHNDLASHGFVCVQTGNAREIFRYLADLNSVRYIRKDHPLPEMEIKFAKDELDSQQLASRQKISMTGLDVWFSSINMNIAFKEEYLKSRKDLDDAKYLRKVYGKMIDEGEIGRIKQKIRELRL